MSVIASITRSVLGHIEKNCQSHDEKTKFLLAIKRFELIPSDLVAKIFSLLPLSDVINARNACKLFHRV